MITTLIILVGLWCGWFVYGLLFFSKDEPLFEQPPIEDFETHYSQN